MQHGSEYFLGQLAGVGQFENMRRDVLAGRRAPFEMQAGLALHARDMRVEPLLGVSVDDGSDLHRGIARDRRS